MFVLLNNLKNWLNVFVTESKQLLWRRKLSTDTKPVSVSAVNMIISLKVEHGRQLSPLYRMLIGCCWAGTWVCVVPSFSLWSCSSKCAHLRQLKVELWGQSAGAGVKKSEWGHQTFCLRLTFLLSSLGLGFFYSLSTILNFINNFSLKEKKHACVPSLTDIYSYF